MYGHDSCSQSYCFLLCGRCDMGMMGLLALSSLISTQGNTDERNTTLSVACYSGGTNSLAQIYLGNAPIPQPLGVLTTDG